MPNDGKAQLLSIGKVNVPITPKMACGKSALITINSEGLSDEIAFIEVSTEIVGSYKMYEAASILAAKRVEDEDGANVLFARLVLAFSPANPIMDYMDDYDSEDIKAPSSTSFFALPRIFKQLKSIGRSKRRRIVEPDHVPDPYLPLGCTLTHFFEQPTK